MSTKQDFSIGSAERLQLRVNGEARDLVVPVNKTLLEVLREDLGLTGTKHGCELGECGACTVLIDGAPMLSCLTLPIEVQGCRIETVEGPAARAASGLRRTRRIAMRLLLAGDVAVRQGAAR